MKIHREDTAIVFIDPQNEVLSEKGSAWPLVRESLQENNTIENMERIFKAAKAHGFEVFISPHYFYPTDKGWKFNGPLETDEATSDMFARKGVLNLDGFEGSGADWLERFKPYIEDGKTIVVAPHRVWGPETNDLVLQLRKRKISKIILGGMLANMCVESHLRELLEQGFEVAVAKDATAAPKHPEWGYGYQAPSSTMRISHTRSGQRTKPSRRWSTVNRSARHQNVHRQRSTCSFHSASCRVRHKGGRGFGRLARRPEAG
jgi:nicotinamidase-related amidase